MRVHLVYPHRRVHTTPSAIGWHIADALSARWETFVYDWTDTCRIRPEPGDVLIGHPHPARWTVLRKSWDDSAWGRRIVLAPFCGSLHYNAFEDHVVRSADEFLAITGLPWFESMPFGPFASWAPRTKQLDLAVDMEAYPFIKTTFAPPGKRRFLYLGNTRWYKDPGYLEEIARCLPNVEMGWIGSGPTLKGFRQHGIVKSDSGAGRSIVAEYDFLIMVGSHDANPTTVVEAMSWGLIPMTTMTAGYDSRDGVIELPHKNPEAAAAILTHWNAADLSDLHALQKDNLLRVEQRFTWERLVDTVLQSVASTERVPTRGLAFRDRFPLALGSIAAPVIFGPRMYREPLKNAAHGVFR